MAGRVLVESALPHIAALRAALPKLWKRPGSRTWVYKAVPLSRMRVKARPGIPNWRAETTGQRASQPLNVTHSRFVTSRFLEVLSLSSVRAWLRLKPQTKRWVGPKMGFLGLVQVCSSREGQNGQNPAT